MVHKENHTTITFIQASELPSFIQMHEVLAGKSGVPKLGVPPVILLMFMGFFLINHPAMAIPPTMETPKSEASHFGHRTTGLFCSDKNPSQSFSKHDPYILYYPIKHFLKKGFINDIERAFYGAS